MEADALEEFPDLDEEDRDEPEPEAVVVIFCSHSLQKGMQIPNNPAHLAATFLFKQ